MDRGDWVRGASPSRPLFSPTAHAKPAGSLQMGRGDDEEDRCAGRAGWVRLGRDHACWRRKPNLEVGGGYNPSGLTLSSHVTQLGSLQSPGLRVDPPYSAHPQRSLRQVAPSRGAARLARGVCSR